MERRSTVRTRSNSLITGATQMTTGTNGTSSGGTRTRHKSGNASYADLITRAIMSSDDKRLTLSEIYDWMVDNVPGLKDQRYLHSAKGWKNAVRHTLSINPRFRKVARLGRPGWWTVDPEYLQRSNLQAGVNAQSSTTTFTTSTFVWDAQSNARRQQQNQGFRGRLASAPALFLSPIFASATGATANVSFPSPTLLSSSVSSRPPSSMSILSSGAMSTPAASPNSEMSPPLLTMSVDNNTQTVQIWQEGGVGLLTVPRPLPMRVSNVHETATQTDENGSHVAPPFSTQGQDAFRRFRHTCDYFENVSPVSSPLGANFLNGAMLMEQPIFEQEQTLLLDRYERNAGNVRASLAQFENGQPILILTNTIVDASSRPQCVDMECPPFGPATPSYNQPAARECNCNALFNGKVDSLEELPEDLEGIDVDPLVSCDVAAVIKYEQDLGRVPKLEIVSGTT